MLANMDMHLTPDIAAFQAVLDGLSPEGRARVGAAAGPAAADDGADVAFTPDW